MQCSYLIYAVEVPKIKLKEKMKNGSKRRREKRKKRKEGICIYFFIKRRKNICVYLSSPLPLVSIASNSKAIKKEIKKNIKYQKKSEKMKRKEMKGKERQIRMVSIVVLCIGKHNRQKHS